MFFFSLWFRIFGALHSECAKRQQRNFTAISQLRRLLSYIAASAEISQRLHSDRQEIAEHLEVFEKWKRSDYAAVVQRLCSDCRVNAQSDCKAISQPFQQ
jgi:DNA-directed RNA polymerase subunit F